MSYKIEISYRTGDSFKTYDETGFVDFSNEDLSIAKENLQRIKIHNDWIKSHNRWSDEKMEVPDFVKRYYPNCVKTNKWADSIDFEATYYLHLLNDDRTETKVCTFWMGFFETLYGASIVSSENDGWSFSY